MRPFDEFPPIGGDSCFDRRLYRGNVVLASIGEIMRLRALGHKRRRQWPRIFTNASAYMGGAPPPDGLEMLPKNPHRPAIAPPQFRPAIGPRRCAKKATSALLCVDRPMPLYIPPTRPACRATRECRERTVCRDEYLALSANSQRPGE